MVKPKPPEAPPVTTAAVPKEITTLPKATVQLPNLSDLAYLVNEEPASPEVPEIVEEDENDVPNEPSVQFTLNDLDKLWQEFTDLQKNAGKDQAVIMLKEPYTLDGNKITITLSNDVLKITFDKLKADLQGFLRANIKHNKIVVEAIVVETAREDMIYTNKEKYTHLAKKYPALQDLQQKLGLDPDY